MKMKRFLSLALAAVLSLSTASVAFAEGDEKFAIGNTKYATLQEAVDKVKEGETIKLLESTKGDGVVVKSGSKFTIDFNGCTYTVNENTVGSPNTKTNGFQLLKDSEITMQNGTIKSGESAKILIQNYSNLTLRDLTLDAREGDACQYVLSNNYGNTVIEGNTNIYASPKNSVGVAFDVYYFLSDAYKDGVSIKIDTTGEIVGTVEYGVSTQGKDAAAEKAKLNVVNGTIDGAITTPGLDDDNKTGINVTGGLFTDASWNNDEYTENAEVAAVLMDGGEEAAYHFGKASDEIDATNYDGVNLKKAPEGSNIKVVGEEVEVKNETGKALTVNGAKVPVDGNVVVNRAPREDNGGDYFGNEKWAKVKREIAAAEEGDTIKVSATGLPWFPSSVARALKGHDITLEIRKNGTTYSVNGEKIGAIEKIWYEFDQLEEKLLTAEAK